MHGLLRVHLMWNITSIFVLPLCMLGTMTLDRLSGTHYIRSSLCRRLLQLTNTFCGLGTKQLAHSNKWPAPSVWTRKDWHFNATYLTASSTNAKFQYNTWQAISFLIIPFSVCVPDQFHQILYSWSRIVIHFHELQSQCTPPVQVHCTMLGLPAPAVTVVTVNESSQTAFIGVLDHPKYYCLRLLSVLYSLTQGQEII